MFLNYWMVFQAVLFALGVYWCWEVLRRWRADVAELREVDDAGRKVAIVAVWSVTAIVAALTVVFAAGMVSNIVRGIQSLM